MATQNEHGRLIAAAGKAALAPIGCFRRRRSRVWLSDERYWAIMVEFQPSGFSKGSYLNVGASWLWYEKRKGLNFNVGYRIDDAGFIPFESLKQFRPMIETMATRAAQEVQSLRATFPTIDAISKFLKDGEDLTSGDFHAAVAAGLSGDIDWARSCFEALLAKPVSTERESALHAEAARFAAASRNFDQFRRVVGEVIKRRRQTAGLSLIEDCLPPVS